jgi:hypothetical protein
MRLYLSLLFISVAACSFGQNALPIYHDSLGYSGNFIEFDEAIDYHSTSIKNDLSKSFIWGGEIDQTMKDRSFSKHNGINRLGFYNTNELRYIQLSKPFLGKESCGWGVKMGYYAAGSVSYNKDLFGLLMYGNSSYLDQTASFSNTISQFMLFQKVGFGLVNRKTKSSIYLNVVNVQQAFKATIDKGELSQNAEGSSLDVLLDGEFAFTEGTDFSQGLGLAIDGEVRFMTPWIKESKAPFSFSVNNLGVAYMYNGMSKYDIDSSYNYSGFTVNQLANSAATFGNDFDVFDSLNIEKTQVKKWLAIPGYIQLMKLVDYNSSKQLQSFFGVRVYPTMRAVPAVFVGVNYRPIQAFSAALSLYYGGFGKIRSGLYLSYLARKITVSLGTDDFLGYVSKNGFGQSLIFKLTWKIKK